MFSTAHVHSGPPRPSFGSQYNLPVQYHKFRKDCTVKSNNIRLPWLIFGVHPIVRKLSIQFVLPHGVMFYCAIGRVGL
jgi:hypothetical protein